MSNLREIKSRLLNRFRNKHLVVLKVVSLNNKQEIFLNAPKTMNCNPGAWVISEYNSKVFVAEVVEVLEEPDKVQKPVGEIIGVVDSQAYHAYRDHLSKIACRLEKGIQEIEEAEFKQQAVETFKLTEEEQAMFGL